MLSGAPLSAFHRFTWLVYWAIIGWYVASDYQDQIRDRKVRTAELERLLAQSRLDTLRTQLHPHFLFNALNAISAHVESAPRTARWMLEQLGDLLRLALDHAEDQVILGINGEDCPITETAGAQGLPPGCGVRLNHELVPVTDLPRRIGEVFRNRRSSDRIVFLAAEEKLNYEGVVRVLDIAQSGVESLKVGLVTDETFARVQP